VEVNTSQEFATETADYHLHRRPDFVPAEGSAAANATSSKGGIVPGPATSQPQKLPLSH